LTGEQPEFTKSSYFVGEPGNWHLKPGAPADVVVEFTLFMESVDAKAPQASVDDILKDLGMK